MNGRMRPFVGLYLALTVLSSCGVKGPGGAWHGASRDRGASVDRVLLTG